MRLEVSKSEALKAYKEAKAEVLKNRNNETWKKFCDEKANCMRLGVRI